MTNVYLPAFYLGVSEELEKAAGLEVESMPMNENILPSINKQTKWRYVRTKDGLKLTDGNLVYSFGGFPEDYPSEDSPVSRTFDDNILNFENDAVSKGTAQIHRASPDNIYLTLANGSHNPTFMLQHEGGKNWRYSPAKKFMEKLKRMQQAKQEEMNSVNIDTPALLDGMQDTVKEAYLSVPSLGAGGMDLDSFTNMLHNTGNKIEGALDWVGHHPVASGVGMYALANNSSLFNHKKPLRSLAIGLIPSVLAAASS